MRLIAKVGIIIGIIIAVMAVAGAALFYTAINMIEEQMGIVLPDDLEQMVLDVNHADLVRNSSAYIGEVVKGTGQIINIEERSSEGQAYLIDAGDGQYYLMYSPRISDAKMQYALFYGTVTGLQKMGLVSGDTVSAVVLNQKYIAFSPAPDSFN